MKRLFLTPLAVAAIFAAATTASAQSPSKPVDLGASAGISIPTFDGAENGFNVQGTIGFGLPMLPFGLRADLTYQKYGTEVADFDFRTISGTANVVMDLMPGPASPYVIAGIGLYNTGIADGDSEDETFTDFGINIGAGIQFNMGLLNPFVEARLHNIFTEDEATRIVPISVGIRF